jgi:hypothetical protein
MQRYINFIVPMYYFRKLVKKNKVRRFGEGGRADPFVYMVRISLFPFYVIKLFFSNYEAFYES